MKRALALSATRSRASRVFSLSLAVVACSSQPETPKTSLPTVSEVPSLEERILICYSTEDTTESAVSRCITSDVDADALASTITRWERAQPVFSDRLFSTASFLERYDLRDGERECLRRAFCRPMPFEER